MKRRVQVYYNLLFLDVRNPIRRTLEGYQEGDSLRPMREFEVESNGEDQQDLNVVWRMFNRVDGSERERLLPPHERSMSMGDVVRFPDEDKNYAVRTFDFEEVTIAKKLMPPFRGKARRGEVG